MVDHMDSKKNNQKLKQLKEPAFIVKPVAKNYGLDYLHLTLIVLVAVLVLLAFGLSYSKPAKVITCTGVCSNSTHNSTAVLAAAESYLASYRSLNSSISLIPYYSLPNQSTVSYMPSDKQWLVTMPYVDPLSSNSIFNITLVMYDSNLSVRQAYLQSIKPPGISNYSVAGLGAISLTTQAECSTTKPIPVYLFADPYAPGMLSALRTAIKASTAYGNSIKMNYYFVFSGYSVSKYKGYGVNTTQYLGRYLSCAAKQQRFNDFVSNLSIGYDGSPLSNLTLYQMALGSGLNTSALGSCIDNTSTSLAYQADLYKSYQVINTPQFVVNCKYLTLPETLDYAINYSLANTK